MEQHEFQVEQAQGKNPLKTFYYNVYTYMRLHGTCVCVCIYMIYIIYIHSYTLFFVYSKVLQVK